MPAPPPKDEPPGFSVTWLLRIQRRGRKAVRRGGVASGFQRWFPWAVLLLLLIEVAVYVWLGVLPRA